MNGFVSILLYIKKIFLLWKIIRCSWNSVLFYASFSLFLAFLALNKLLTLNNVVIYILCFPPSPQDLPCHVHLDAILDLPLFFTAHSLWLCQMRLCHSKFLSSALLFHQLQLIFLAAGSIFGIFQHLLLSEHNSYLTLDMISHTGQS